MLNLTFELKGKKQINLLSKTILELKNNKAQELANTETD